MKKIDDFVDEETAILYSNIIAKAILSTIIIIIALIVIFLTQTVLIPIIQESVKIECAKYTADSLLENRDKLAQDIEQDIKIKFKHNYIDLTATAI